MRPPDYRKYSVRELEEALESVDRHVYPERARAIEEELERRDALETAGDSAANDTDTRDRKESLGCAGGCLILMGVLQILPGLLLLVVASWLIPEVDVADEIGLSLRTLLTSPIGNLATGIAVVWLGIGSIMTRRWARPLVQVMAAYWVAFGIMSLLVAPFVIPRIPDFSWTAQVIMMGAILLVLSALQVGIPLAFVSFYGRSDVKAIFEQEDPRRRWTDECPLPVLGLSVLLVWIGFVIWLPVHGMGFVFLGVFTRGIPGDLLRIGVSIACAIVAWGVYRMDRRAWVAAFLLIGLLSVSSFIVLWVNDPDDYLEGIGVSQFELEALSENDFAVERALMLLSSLTSISLLGYLIYVRKYFFPKIGEKAAGVQGVRK